MTSKDTSPDTIRTAADLRGEYAAVLDQCRVLVPEHQADAVLAVRDHQTEQLRQQLTAVETERDAVYRERAHLVAHLAALYPSHIGYTDPNAPDWAIVIVEAPGGQPSWHIAERDLDLFEHVIPTNRICRGWDGHTTDEKYERIRALTASSAPAWAAGTTGAAGVKSVSEPMRAKKLVHWLDLGDAGLHGAHPYNELVSSRMYGDGRRSSRSSRPELAGRRG
ncbi:hypothetical protein [Streptomyces sp. URMC 124]|uniref:WDGH domain-containing protein n=1 Tax=Streptomyces sp. URMC 124 TaxID=3423405 RepID=UPI003F1B8CF3